MTFSLELLDEYKISYQLGWNRHFRKFDSSTQKIIYKKIHQLESPIVGRHLCHGLEHFVEDVGGYRIVYLSDEIARVRTIIFVGDHKQYEKWYKS